MKIDRIYLASRSPRRRELLTQIGVHFDTLLFRGEMRTDAAVDETPLPGETPEIYVERVARAKAEHGAQLLAWRKLPFYPILSADTTLAFEGQIIGKPYSPAHAKQILHALSGKTHEVLTGVAVNDGSTTHYILSRSEVRFRSLSDQEIAHYVATGEPMDKAGAYGIQGRAGLFVAHLSGSYTGVMGLPLCETGLLLQQAGYVL